MYANSKGGEWGLFIIGFSPTSDLIVVDCKPEALDCEPEVKLFGTLSVIWYINFVEASGLGVGGLEWIGVTCCW